MGTEPENYLDFLPDIFEHLPGIERDDTELVKRFLQIFQEQFEQIEDKIVRFPEIVLDPSTARTDFLPYLASWIALEFPEGWDEVTRRKLIKQMMEIYPMRGRKKALDRVLKIYLNPLDLKELGINEIPPHIFSISFDFPKYEPLQLYNLFNEVGAVVQREKPAHTYFFWDVKVPTMQICKLELDDDGKPKAIGHSRVGVDTFLGNSAAPENSDSNNNP